MPGIVVSVFQLHSLKIENEYSVATPHILPKGPSQKVGFIKWKSPIIVLIYHFVV